jgi:hypothetical protein
VIEQLSSRTSSLDAITLRVRANQGQGSDNGGTLDYYNDGTYKYLKWVGELALGNPSSGFYNYTIHYMPTYFAFYAGGVLLGSYNSTTATAGLPNSTMAITLFVSANTSPKVSDAMYVQSVYFTQAESTKAECDSNDDDSAGMPGRGSVGDYFSFVLLALLVLFIM